MDATPLVGSDRQEALRTAAGWDDGSGVLAAFARTGTLGSEAELDCVIASLEDAITAAEDRAEGREHPAWRQECEFLRMALVIALEAVPEAGHAVVR